MKKIEFAYNEPMIGQIETTNDGLTDEDIILLIEREFPEAIDIEILNVNHI